MKRDNQYWTYTFLIEVTFRLHFCTITLVLLISLQKNFICVDAVSGYLIETCSGSTCTNVSGTSLAGGRRVVATMNLAKERIYSATLYVQYNGGVEQRLLPVDISEC